MSAPRRRRGSGGGGHDGADERWLLTYSDMITLLMALFIVMWSISSVNISKFSALKESLHQAFSGKIISGNQAILSGETSVLQSPGTPVPSVQDSAGASSSSSSSGISSIANLQASIRAQIVSALAKRDLENLRRLQRQVDAYAKAHGLAGRLRTAIDERGLVVHVLTDDLVFASGSAVLEPRSQPLLERLARLLTEPGLVNPVRVEGNTDDVPISTAQFHSNWELSTARATAVLAFLIAHGVPEHRLSVAGYADQRPIASNAGATGRSLNRRVDLVVLRRAT